MPNIACANKLFPDPLEPNTAKISPSSISKVKSVITLRFCCFNPFVYCINEIDTLLTSNSLFILTLPSYLHLQD